MKPGNIAIVGAAETTELGVIPHMSQIQLHAWPFCTLLVLPAETDVHRP